jgi:FkbM family methyltransferase
LLFVVLLAPLPYGRGSVKKQTSPFKRRGVKMTMTLTDQTADSIRFDYTLCWDERGRWRPRTNQIDLACASPDDFLARLISARGEFYEIDLLEYLATRGPRGGTFIDVGANIGNHSVYFGKLLADHVVAIEPQPEIATILQRNLEANGVSNSTVVTSGLGSEVGFARPVYPSGETKNAGATRLETTTPQSEASECVPVTTLDVLANEVHDKTGRAPITLIKIDVEGMELDVLRGGTRVLKSQQPQLTVELSSPESRQSVTNFLAEFGYTAVGRFCYTPTYHFINPRVHRLRKGPSRLTRFWHQGFPARVRRSLQCSARTSEKICASADIRAASDET